MMQDVVKHKFDYSLLALISALFVLYFLKERYIPVNLLAATMIYSCAYVMWGLWHHSRVGSFNRHVVLEYFLVAVIGIVIVSSLLL